MKRNFIFILPSFIFFTLFISCQQEIDIVLDTASKGALKKDSNGDCQPIQVAGTFIAGQNPGDTNYLIAEVNVTKTGTYSIMTDTINGYSFIATGNFSNTGSRPVKLAVFGRPIAAGTNNFTIKYDSGNCRVAVTVRPNLTSPASFTLQGAPNACTNAVVTGNFVKNIVLDSTGKVSISLNVATPGTYTISTNSVNGYSFTGSGVVSATGIQTITLKASGTPLNIGVNVFTVTAGASSCTFPVTVLAPVVTTNSDHFPLTQNSHWTYDDIFRPGDSVKRTITGTITINGQLYTIMDEQPMFGSLVPYFFRKTGDEYFEYGKVDKYTISFQYGPAINGELPFLKENLSTGDTWKSAEFSGTATFGQVIILEYRYSCTNANATVTINGNAFTNIYIITMMPFIKSTGNSYGSTNEIYTYYYAKGVGIVYAIKIKDGFKHYEWQIRNNWLVN